jgi:O-methyltransferase domain
MTSARGKVFYGWWVASIAALGLFLPSSGPVGRPLWSADEGNLRPRGRLFDVVMLVTTGGKERKAEEYRQLLASAGFRLNQVILTSSVLSIIEALPV